MLVTDLLKSFDDHSLSSLYLFCPGKAPRARESTFEPVLAQEAVALFTQRVVDPGMKDLCFNAFYADEADVGEIVSVAETLPFLTDRRLIVVHEAQHLERKDRTESILPYLENPCESTILLLVAATVDRRLKLFKTCESKGVVIECPELRESDVSAWVRREVDRTGKSIAAEAVAALVDRAGTRLADVRNAITLVTNYVGHAGVVRREDVETACTDVQEEVVWTLTDAIANSDTKLAVKSLRTLLDLSPDPSQPFVILGSINWLLKMAYLTAIRDTSRVKSFVADKVRPLASKFGVGKLKDAFALCTQTDLMLRSTGVDRNLALELLVIKLAATRKPAKA